MEPTPATTRSAVIIIHNDDDEGEQRSSTISARLPVQRSLTVDSSLPLPSRSSLPSTSRRASFDQLHQEHMTIHNVETLASASSTRRSSQSGSPMLTPPLLPQYSLDNSLHLTPPASPSPFMQTFTSSDQPPTRPKMTFAARWMQNNPMFDPTALDEKRHQQQHQQPQKRQQRRFKRFLYLVILPTAAVLLLAAVASSLTPPSWPSRLPFFFQTRKKIQGEYQWRKRDLLEKRQAIESSPPIFSVPDALTGGDSTTTTPTPTSTSPSASNSNSSSTGINSAATTVAPPVAATPTLPTPFPQPFDSTLSIDFVTGTCQLFFTGLTSNIQFRQCRPLSLLLPSSNAFLQAQLQGNLTLVNAILYGTCNTAPSEEECVGRMQGWETEIKQSCATELDQGHTLSWSALNGFRNYKMVRDVGCLRNMRTDTYCYVDALVATPPADIYLYQLPLGTPLPGSTTSSTASAQATGGGGGVNVKPSCSSCSQSVMNIYAQYATNSSLLISQTYPSAQRAVEAACGSGYASAVNAAVRSRVWSGSGVGALVGVLLVSLFVAGLGW